MVKTIKYIFVILSAAYFLLAGTGYNVTKYCCNGCKIKVVQKSEQIAFHKERLPFKTNCCEKKEPIQDANTTCLVVNKHTEKCFFIRITVDIPTTEAFVDLFNHSVKQIELFYTLIPDLKMNQQLVYENIYPPPNPLFLKTGRELLALKAVLLI
jgi:hypothetical protein